MEQYYYNRMNKIEQAVYHALYQGFLNIDEEIQIPRLEGEALYNVFFKLRLDHPEIFWATGYKYKYYNDSPNLIFVPEYLFEKAKIKEHQKAMTARVEKITREAKTFSQWDKEKYIHDFLCESIHYDKLKKPYSHEIIGPLGHGVGVCEGIAKSVKVLCDALGIWCMIAVCGNNPEKGIKYRHTWNIVKIDGQYYHLDVTFDNTLGNYEKKENQKPENKTPRNTSGKNKAGKAEQMDFRYDYFNLDDKNIFRDHEPLLYPAPACNEDGHFYYKEKKLSFTKIEDVYKRSLQAAKKGRVLTFHWRGGYLTKEVLKELLEEIERAGREKNKQPQISLNWAQAVLRVEYQELPEGIIRETKVVMEDANEGEREIIGNMETLGRGLTLRRSHVDNAEENQLIKSLDDALQYMSKRRIGALITIERETQLDDYIKTGIKLDAAISGQLLINTFIPNTPLHDGAVIISKDRIAAAAAYLPLSESVRIPKELGTRHRAAVGISEASDAITVVVSEETGEISITQNGDLLRRMDQESYLNFFKHQFLASDEDLAAKKHWWQKKGRSAS